ncbi:hypothetical protein KBC54_04895, partial [Patescibacteria group bacterium]|nr:hypothetical protein [Patescibacteria group bacterium]
MRLIPGNVLPLALIMTMTILMAGIGIGSVVLEGSHRSREAVDSVAAYYMADAGIERQLFEIRKNNQSVDYLDKLGVIKYPNYPNESSWKPSGFIEPTSNKTFSSIATSSFAVVDLFNPDNLLAPPGVKKLNIKWSTAGTCPVSTLEVSYSFWDLTGGVPKLPDENVTSTYVVLDKNNKRDMDVLDLDPQRSYRMRIRAFDCAAQNIVVQAYNSANQPMSIPGDITLSAEGTYNKATQKIAVTM